MINLLDYINDNSHVKKLKVDDLLFTEFKCPLDDEGSKIWWHNNFFAHVLSGETVIKTPGRQYTLTTGSSVFAKKGSIVSYSHEDDNFCELLVFVPDEFIKTVIRKYQLPLADVAHDNAPETVIPLTGNEVLTAYFQSLLIHFSQPNPPAEQLLKLKFEELLLHIFSGNTHSPVKMYFSEICKSTKPSIKDIMECNFFSNLGLEEFARLCARSLTGFKKEFQEIYHDTPGKWLQKKRLDYARYLLDCTDYTIDKICFESGFEDSSHFIRAFKNKYGVPPGKLKSQNIAGRPA